MILSNKLLRPIFVVCLMLPSIMLGDYQSPCFVSLGADCLAAGMIRHFGKREAAFPFDWVTSLDEGALIQLLDSNFQDFTHPEYLVRHPINNSALVHRLYHIEFSHDWLEEYWQDGDKIDQGIKRLQTKYERRIARFQQLANYQGTVIFIRTIGSSYQHILENPANYWFDHSPTENVKEFAFTLNNALRKFFPFLDFKLLIVKRIDGQNSIDSFGKITLCFFSNIEEHRNWEPLFSQER